MPDLIIVRLHPTEPVTAQTFTQALTGLTITAYDLTFGDSTHGVAIGTAKGLADPHVPPGGIDPVDDSVDLTQTQIIQHYKDVTIGLGTKVRALQSAATAVIVADPPGGHTEYPTANSFDLRLDISRNGTQIADKTLDFNIVVTTVTTLPTDQPACFGMAPSAYATLPPLLGNTVIEVPPDGTAPAFDRLAKAIDAVLAKDPADGVALKDRGPLTAAQSRQIAWELVWDRTVYPPPAEPRPLGEMYTKPSDSQDIDRDADNDRKRFEGELTGYHATHGAEADRLAKFVFTASAAVQCELLSAGGTIPKAGASGEDLVGARLAAFPFPVITGAGAPLDTAVILQPASGATLVDQFTVPAAYFYALAASLPAQVGVGQRYDMARFGAETKTLQEIRTAIDAGSVTVSEQPSTQPSAAVNPAQAARRLHALGTVPGSLPAVRYDASIGLLVTDWLAYADSTAEIDAKFWQAEVTATHPAAYLDLLLHVVTESFQPLIDAITGPPLGITSAPALVAVTDQRWRDLFRTPEPRLDLLPPFTQPGTPAQRTEAFIRRLRKFFTVPPGAVSGTGATPEGPPALHTSAADVFARFSAAYAAHGGGTFAFGTARDADASSAAVADTCPGDREAQAWLAETLDIVDALCRLTAFAAPPDARAELRFSLMEALYARGFSDAEGVRALAPADFQAALAGTVAHPYATDIQAAAGGSTASGPRAPEGFQPVNPDGALTDCVPPAHLSPFGPVGYLHELLLASAASTLAQPVVPGDPDPVGTLLAGRRGPLGRLHVTRANLETPLPAIDLVNESLENLAAAVAPGGSAAAAGAVHDTASDALAGHALHGPDATSGHDPATLFAAIPEHSSPAAVAAPAAGTAAYAALRTDFSAPRLPYDQPLDVARSYLRQARTTRFEAMRRFRRRITEFVLDPEHEPAGFADHLWRYPVSFDIAREYLGVSTEEYDLLYRQDITDDENPGAGRLALHQLYGFASGTLNGTPWTEIVLDVATFLPRTGLDYCELLDLQRCGFVGFVRAGSGNGERADGERPEGERAGGEYGGFPPCEPCCLDDLRIAFTDPHHAQDPTTALRKLAVFIRLWRTLRNGPVRHLTFATAARLARELHLFHGDTVNPDHLRQLAALLMLTGELRLRGQSPLALLPLWQTPRPGTWEDTVALLLDAAEDHAEARHRCPRRGPEFRKVIADNLGPLSVLAGFDPDTPGDTWYALPTHTLRLVEVLGKIYASDFTVGEILFLFTTGGHLDGDDPFPQQDANEALDDPLALPEAEEGEEGDGEHSLWALRRTLLGIRVESEQARQWSWPRIVASLREEFGHLTPSGGPDPLTALGRRFFPGTLRRCGHSADPRDQQYRTPLAAADTSPHMWTAPPDGPFGYDEAAEELWTSLPLTDAAVIRRLSVLRPLGDAERVAVRNLYFAPRAALAPIAAVFENFDHAVDRLVQEPDEAARFTFFQHEFARFHLRCRAVAEHLAAHVRAVTGRAEPGDGHAAAWRVLRALLADENAARTPWEDDSGRPPETTWGPRPSGGAFSALLGLAGTGLLGEFRTAGGDLVWRETRGPLSAFGPVRDAHNAPVPTVLPAMGLELTQDQLRFVGARNGFAFLDSDGEPLGGAQPFSVCWSGVLLVEERGAYRFHAGPPAGDSGEPGPEAAAHQGWRITVGRGQKTWTLLNHHWGGEDAPAHHSEPLTLRRGAYRIRVELAQHRPAFDRPEDICPVTTGFQVTYAGPDTGGVPQSLPYDRLFRDTKDSTLGSGIVRHDHTDVPNDSGPRGAADPIHAGEQAAAYLDRHYTSTLRDIRRTYQRAFKALLFTERFRLSAHPVPGYRQSELGFLLDSPQAFEGTAHPRTGSGSFGVHHAWFDPDLLPVADPYPPVELLGRDTAVPDQRSDPSPQRQAALFDWWERIFDYCALRARTERARERPAWLLFAEVAERKPDNPAELLRHLGVDLRHAPLVLTQFDPRATPPLYAVGDLGSPDLTDERWPVRIWHAETWLRELRRHFAVARIETARPALWAADDPGAQVDAPPWISPPQSGNANLTRFLQDGFLERGEPRRYEDLRRLNDGLRERARNALLAYLCGRDRVALPWAAGRYARTPQDLSDLLLQDVECGLAQRASRVEEAVGAVQTYIQRARLGLEPGFTVTPAFARLWERRFAAFPVWSAARRREIYRENWIEWDELRTADGSEAFRFLRDELRRSALTVPVPGGPEWWPEPSGGRPPAHPALVARQALEPAEIHLLPTPPEGLGLLGTPRHAAQPSWLAPVSYGDNDGDSGQSGERGGEDAAVAATGGAPSADGRRLPLWLQAAANLGARFVRVAAAGTPRASAAFVPRPHLREDDCRARYGQERPATVDEYYFWLADARFFAESGAPQHADAGIVVEHDPAVTAQQTSDWHRPDALPGLLNWEPEQQVHLYWSRLRDGEFEPPRRSDEALAVTGEATALRFDGRTGDSLRFEAVDGPVNVGVTPTGYGNYPGAPAPGFRYDLATDSAVVLPLVAEPGGPAQQEHFGLPAYPFFAYAAPGAPLLPQSPFAVAMTVAGALRTRCGFEAALKWYELVYVPTSRDNTWAHCFTDGARFTDDAGLTDDARARNRRRDVECCPTSPVTDDQARDRAVLLEYLDTLLRWGDSLLCRNSPESSRQAAVLFETADRLLGARPTVVPAQDDTGTPRTVATFRARPAPLNPRLTALYERTADRLAMVRHALNGRRLHGRNGGADRAFWGDDALGDEGYGAAVDACDAECPGGQECLCRTGPYRFGYLVQKALDLAGEVRSLGAELLAAYEKGDAEALAALRAAHERQLAELTRSTRQFQWREADWQVQALQKTKEGALARLRYHQQLILRGLNAGETAYEALTGVSMTSRTVGNVSEAIAQGIGIIPDIAVGVAGLGPYEATQLPIGTKLANASFATAARIMNALADIAGTGAGLSLTESGWQRRLEEWQHQVEITGIEIDQIERQILAAERHRDAALRDLDNQQRQYEHTVEVQDFLRDKFTHTELYLYLQKETAALHRRLYEVALRTARRAQRAYTHERAEPGRAFLPESGWDNLRDGLAAGERLQVALRQMEIAYLEANCREYELTKHLSLRLDFPSAFLRLQTTGTAEIEIPEWLFDLDHPGHYLRRIKNVTLSVPCVVGPYTGVHCRLTLLSSTTRLTPRLTAPVAGCCGERGDECHCPDGYRPLPDDSRLTRSFAATEAIATSSGQNDSGLFELNFRDERYLPFEFAGAVSRWRIELPPENNRFDFDTLADVVLHLNYTAREGGEALRRAAGALAQRHLPGAGLRLFDIRHDFPDDWYRLTSGEPDGRHVLPLKLGREHFPFLPGERDLKVTRVELFVELTDVEFTDPDRRAALPVRFVTEHESDHGVREACRCSCHDIECVSSAEWPALYHGVLDIALRPLRHRGDRELGQFHFPALRQPLGRVFMICRYSASHAKGGRR
ncbi:neuraminidase-like domain-containing protein [Streptomyces sp. NPDC001339]|uniref:Tc toxin subunit A-related protein n=1 Tax=Streptomyces sp. NPDC001339 TaxID=3364563 RepID=UPI00369B40A5